MNLLKVSDMAVNASISACAAAGQPQMARRLLKDPGVCIGPYWVTQANA